MRHQRSSRPDRIPRRDEFGHPAHDFGMVGAPMVGMDSPVWARIQDERLQRGAVVAQHMGATGLALAIDDETQAFASTANPAHSSFVA